MEKGLVLQERDVELLEFLAEYKTITLDNTRYIYGTKTYQEKRICHLVKEKYLTDLIKDCHTIIIDKSIIEEYLEKDYKEKLNL